MKIFINNENKIVLFFLPYKAYKRAFKFLIVSLM